MTRARGELPEAEEALLGIERDTPEQEAKQEKERKEALEFERTMLLNLMGSEQFRNWLMTLLISLHTFEQPFAAGPTGFPDPNATWFNAGMKAAGWHIWEVFDALSPDLASKMRREYRQPR